MEYVPGGELFDYLVKRGRLPLSEALHYFQQIIHAVDYCHRFNICHRDLKPENLLLDKDKNIKVADFGTSRFLEIAAHGTTVIGSPPYMAPEQFYGKAVFASDVYSLGVTIYQMMTGSLPYDTPAPADIERLMRGELLSAPRLKNPKIPKAISDIVVKAMAPELTARYQRASEVMNDLLGAREPTTAPRRAVRGTPGSSAAGDAVAEIQSRLKAREQPQARFCWHCRKPLQARTAKCPFCGEAQ